MYIVDKLLSLGQKETDFLKSPDIQNFPEGACQLCGGKSWCCPECGDDKAFKKSLINPHEVGTLPHDVKVEDPFNDPDLQETLQNDTPEP